MGTDSKPGAVVLDRRQVYRPFLERLTPLVSSGLAADADLIVPRGHDPRDPEQPPIHVVFARSAELNRGTQMAIVGGTGSGKTTELQLTCNVLGRHTDAINILLDLADHTNLSDSSTGSILATAGMELYSRLGHADRQSATVSAAYRSLRNLAFGTTKWVEYPEYGPDDFEDVDEPPMTPVRIPGVMKPRFPAFRHQVAQLKEQLLTIIEPIQKTDTQITLLIDGLDRLMGANRFRDFAEQDLRALRGTGITVVVVAPLLLWYDKSRFLHDYFDSVKHIPAAMAGTNDFAFLRQILERRGAQGLLDQPQISSIVEFSGGVIRDLITLTRSAAEYAYGDDQDRIGRNHVETAVRQLGQRYLCGLGKREEQRLRQLADGATFQTDDPASRELIVNRQVLEYFESGRESYVVHPALAEVLPKSA